MKVYIEIKTSNGYIVKVDPSDYEMISNWSWRVNKQGYAVRNSTKKQISMHQQVMGNMEGKEIDHKDRNKLNNTRDNLRFVTRSQNNLNRPIDPRNQLGHNGISKCKTGSYRVRLSTKELGRYKTLKEAIKVRKSAEREAFLSGETNQ